VTSESAPGAIVTDTRAVERVHAYGTLRLRVQLGPDLAAETIATTQGKALRDALEASRLIEPVRGTDASAAACIYLIAPRTSVADGDPVPQLGPIAAPTWVVVATDGQMLMPPKPIDAFADVVANLETLARHRQALALDNPNPASVLRGKFELNVLRHAADGQWVVAEPEAAGGLPVFVEGDEIAFEIKSRHDAQAYVSLVYFGATGEISLVFPAPNNSDQITPTVRFQVGTRPDDDRFSVSYPKEYPFGAPGAAAMDALESVKLFVTTAEAGFGFLAQQGMRGGEQRTGALQLLWETAAGVAPMRGLERTKAMPVDTDDWTTLVRPYLIRRKAASA
jgi:hypothetical protein